MAGPRPPRTDNPIDDEQARQAHQPQGVERPQGPSSMLLSREERVVVPPVPGAEGDPLVPLASGAIGTAGTTRVRSEADLLLEYITSSGSRVWTQFGTPMALGGNSAGIHVLPPYIDELERDFGTDMYQRMLNDAQIKAADATLRAAILDKPIQISSPLDPEEERDPARLAMADAVATFCRAVLEQLPQDFQQFAWEMLEGMAMGYKLAEQVYEVREVVPGNGPQTVIKSLNPKPQEAVSFVVDQYNHLLGYLPRRPGAGLQSAAVVDRDGTIPGLIPPEKVARFTWNPRNDDPRGVSHLRAAYVPWRLKIGLYPAYEAYLARFAQPSAAWELDGANLPPMVDQDGNLVKDPAAVMLAMVRNLQNFQSGGAMVVPAGKIGLVQANSKGDAYLAAYELCNNEIVKSILLQDLATSGAKYGTRALGEVHQDTMGLVVSYGKVAFCNFVREQILAPVVRYNYGEAGVALLPNVSLGEVEQQDFSKVASAVAGLQGAGLLFPTQLNEIYEMLHLPVLPPELIARLEQKMQAELDAAVMSATMASDPLGQLLMSGGPLPGEGGGGAEGGGESGGEAKPKPPARKSQG